MADDKEQNDEAETPAEGAEGEGAPAKGRNIKKLLMIIVPIVLLLGGGAGAYFTGALDGLLGKKLAAEAHGEEGEEVAAEGEEAAAEEEGAHAEDSHAAAETKADAHGGGGGGEHGAAAPGPGPYFLKVADEKGQDLVVNLNSPDGQMRFLQLGVQLELAKPGDIDKVKAVMPRVIDQFQTYLRELRIKDLRGSAGIYRLQIELLARVNQAAAPVKVKDVLFEKILIQ